MLRGYRRGRAYAALRRRGLGDLAVVGRADLGLAEQRRAPSEEVRLHDVVGVAVEIGRQLLELAQLDGSKTLEQALRARLATRGARGTDEDSMAAGQAKVETTSVDSAIAEIADG